ncbi:class I SAM-dependent methyltransferase [Bradyrhizobium sp. CB1015]|uniref:methyltransferase domain-containing protein n=1 Tax=Bradyrhizobium sp. CB1015 TaxID=2976822 RepID=UPI0021AA039C|nr:class I SAM-dependent methyltransferase [Bradyrhizobium sp. CB1015]UWU92917.1 methyltransferase domain-containing protein [Bradyrhizobium sp. CB1015]
MSWKRVAAAWQRGGTGLAARVMLERASDFCWERYFGIRSAGLVPIETLLSDWNGCHDYFPSARRAFHHLMAHVDICAGRDVFVDFGAGKGRALLMAAQYPFKRVVGIEISETLCQEAHRNLARWNGALVCTDIDILAGDASHYVVPADATVLYFYNPFHGRTLHAVFEAIAQSHATTPRRIWVIFNNTAHFLAIERQFPWLTVVARPTFEHDCGVYKIAGDG